MSTPPLFTPVNFPTFNERYEESQQRRTGGFKKWSPRKGPIGRAWRNVIRMMPPHVNMEGDPIVGSLVHFSLGPGLDTFSPCLAWWEEECPACLWNQELRARQRVESDPNRAKQLREMVYKQRQQDNFVCQVADMAHPEQGVLPYFFSGGVEKMLRSCFYSHDQPPQPRDITDPTNGRDIIMDVSTKPGPDEYPSYDLVTPRDTPSPLFDMKWLEQLQDLVAEHVFKPTRDEVAQALQGRKIDRRGGGVAITAGTPPAAQGRLPAPPVAAPTPGAATVVAPAPPTPIPETAQAAPPVAGGRRGGRPGRVAAAAVSGPVETTATPLPASSAPPAVTVSTPPPMQRVAVTDTPPLPYAAARTRLQSLSVPFLEITREKVIQKEAAGIATTVPCYKKGTDPADKVCQQCIMILPCLTATAQLPE